MWNSLAEGQLELYREIQRVWRGTSPGGCLLVHLASLPAAGFMFIMALFPLSCRTGASVWGSSRHTAVGALLHILE